jgi:hypothetical protein
MIYGEGLQLVSCARQMISGTFYSEKAVMTREMIAQAAKETVGAQFHVAPMAIA